MLNALRTPVPIALTPHRVKRSGKFVRPTRRQAIGAVVITCLQCKHRPFHQLRTFIAHVQKNHALVLLQSELNLPVASYDFTGLKRGQPAVWYPNAEAQP